MLPIVIKKDIKMIYRSLIVILLIIFSHASLSANQQKSIIYHGSTPGSYSLPSLMLTALQQPDFIELPLLLSKDNVPIVYSDIFLQSQTNVADIFPGRSRQDGNFYLIDFSLAEIEQLSYNKNQKLHNITTHPMSFADILVLISVVTENIEKPLQILPVVKYPWFHTNESKDISSIVVEALIAQAGIAETPLYLKCYDPEELQRLHKKLLPDLPVEIKLVQGIDGANGRETMRQKRGTWYSYNYDWLFTRLGLRVLAGYADSLSLASATITNEETLSRLIIDSQGLKMQVFIDIDDSQLDSSTPLFERLLFSLNADGLALSQPKLLQAFLAGRNETDPGFDIEDPGEKSDLDSTSIFSDPEALSRRLQNIQ